MNNDDGVTVFEVLFGFAALLSLCLIGGILYVVVYFIVKFW